MRIHTNKPCLWVAVVSVLHLAFTACSERALEPDFKNPSDVFRPATDDQSEEALLRRQFQEQTGCYLLFNDTLQQEYLGTDINGTPRYFVETLDMTYSVGLSAYISTSYTYTYLDTQEQKSEAADFIQRFIMPHLTGTLRPYSWFAANVITGWADSGASTGKPYAITNQRCIAIASNYLVQRERTDAQKEQYAQRILNIVIGQLATNNSDAFSAFYAISADYYGRDYRTLGYDGKPSTSELYALGFLSSTSISSFPSTTQDLNSYALLAIQYTDEQLQQQYANYPLVLQKAAIVRAVLVELGYRV